MRLSPAGLRIVRISPRVLTPRPIGFDKIRRRSSVRFLFPTVLDPLTHKRIPFDVYAEKFNITRAFFKILEPIAERSPLKIFLVNSVRFLQGRRPWRNTRSTCRARETVTRAPNKNRPVQISARKIR